MNVSSSRIEIHKSLWIDLRKTDYTDRDLFDLETDDGASYVGLGALAHDAAASPTRFAHGTQK